MIEEIRAYWIRNSTNRKNILKRNRAQSPNRFFLKFKEGITQFYDMDFYRTELNN